MTLDAKQSIIAWVSVSVFVGLFALSLAMHLKRFIPQWTVSFGQGLILLSLVVRFGSWLWRHRKEQVING